MLPNIVFVVIPVFIFVISLALVFFWDRKKNSTISEEPGNTSAEGAFRSIYHQLWVLIFWAGLILVLPLWISFKLRISSMGSHDRWLHLGKILIFPLLLLALLQYGYQKGYLKWIQDLQWPDKENK
jgi:NADH:ubiquinone oxidoreductase subunit 3 (subunit A)